MGATEPERLDGARVTARWFRTMGVAPAVGRDFDDSDDRPGAPRVAIVSDALWRTAASAVLAPCSAARSSSTATTLR